MNGEPSSIRTDVLLAPLTTIGLGGRARYFASCPTVDSIRDAIAFAQRRGLRLHILGGGSNTIFADEGFDGLVLKIDLRGISREDTGTLVRLRAAAGEPWDDLVRQCIADGLGGLECLSAIPGSAGATPIQNVGAYGQEVSDTISCVRALDRKDVTEVAFTPEECRFDYRMSRFKSTDAGRYVILEVEFTLRKNAAPSIRYPELQRAIDTSLDLKSLPRGAPALSAVRSVVFELRRRKSMLIDPADPNTKSVGSFFVNPVVSVAEFDAVRSRWAALGGKDPIPVFPSGEQRKIPAAWLVEHAGYGRGSQRGGVGISENHTLALVNRGATSREILAYAEEIRAAVAEKFDIVLQLEPVVVS
jgi:UDP-N-acetylmuramate dehydrogenase